MSYTIQVGHFTNQQPIWWNNFLHSLPLIKSKDAYISAIDQNLKQWNAVYLHHSVSIPTVIFETEKDASIFILRWS